ncbi:hypothetical protein B0H13DRAFT_1855500 [Mycena leptocephala]|nr:hypothetical protein B0H13DRAFT_1855500 [Mycena leptocephala]
MNETQSQITAGHAHVIVTSLPSAHHGRQSKTQWRRGNALNGRRAKEEGQVYLYVYRNASASVTERFLCWPLDRLERALADASVSSLAKKRLIPRPKGQAGRSGGYNIQDAMGLSEDSARYNQLFRIVKDYTKRYLSVFDTISDQDKTRLEKTKVKIAKAALYFSKFQGLWPIHDIIASYLLGMQTRRRSDMRLEKEAEARDSERSGKARNLAVTVDDSDGSMESDNGDDSETEEENVRPACKSKSATKARRIDSDDDEEDAAETKEKVPNGARQS